MTSVIFAELETIRADLQLSRLEFARALGFTPASYTGWARGTVVPREKILRRARELAARGTGDLGPVPEPRKLTNKELIDHAGEIFKEILSRFLLDRES